MGLTRRRFLGGCALTAGGGLLDMCVIEPRWLRIMHQEVPLPEGTTKTGIKLLHLSDLHLSKHVSLKQIDAAIDKGLQLNPDLVCLTGDFITHQHAEDSGYSEVLKKLPAHCPTFATSGNHDGGSWARPQGGYADLAPLQELLNRSEIRLIDNRSKTFTCAQGELQLIGVGDLWSHAVNAPRAYAKTDSAAPTVLLAHNPDTKDQLMNRNWDLMLSGHTHGGQLRIPFSGAAPVAPVRDKRYVDGLHEIAPGKFLHVSRGVGNLLGMRLNCRPEINLLTLTS